MSVINMYFRRWCEKEQRYYYNDHRSWRDWYSDPFAGKSLGARGDRVEDLLGPLELLVDKSDINNLVYMSFDKINRMYKESKLCQNKDAQPVDQKSE